MEEDNLVTPEQQEVVEEPIVEEQPEMNDPNDSAVDINGVPVPSEEVEVNHFDRYLEKIDPAITEDRDALLKYLADATIDMSTGPVRVDGFDLLQMKNEQLSNYGHEEIPLDGYVETSSITDEEDGPVLHDLMLKHE